jgi:hypothetical protein
MSTPEGEIQLAICKYLREQGYFFWRSNNTPTYDPKMNNGLGGYRSQGEFSQPGLSDICLVHGDNYGQFVALEVKAPKGRQSTDQKLFERRCGLSNARYHVVKSVDDVKALGL